MIRPRDGSSPKHRKWVILGLSVCIVAAGAGGGIYWFFHVRGTESRNSIRTGNGLTFAESYASVRIAAANVSGGPWLPTSVLGIASEVPAAPVPNYKDSLNLTMRLCGAVPGVTVWNSSGIPIFTGTLNSGAAPFWSFIFKNASGTYLYATNLEGKVNVYGPSATFESCLQAAGIGSSNFVNPAVDTPEVAEDAYVAAGENFSIKHSALAEYYVLGNDQILEPDASSFGWVVNYFVCDTVGVSGIENYTAVGVLTSGGKSTTFVDNGWLGCTLSDYRLAFGAISANSTTSFGSTTDVSLPFQVTAPGALANNTTLYDGWGLVSWMTQLHLQATGAKELPVAIATCRFWTSSLTSCPANSSGWFAVLLSQNGAWLDSYPSSANSSEWTVPNVIVSSQDQLVLVCPESWNVSGDTINVTAGPLAPQVSGSAAL